MPKPTTKQMKIAKEVTKDLREIITPYAGRAFCCAAAPAEWYGAANKAHIEEVSLIVAQTESADELSKAVLRLIHTYVKIRDDYLAEEKERKRSSAILGQVFEKLEQQSLVEDHMVRTVKKLLQQTNSPTLIESLRRWSCISPVPVERADIIASPTRI